MVITANIQLTKTFSGLLFYFKHPPTRISFKPEDFTFGIDTWYYVPTACYGAVRQAACPLFFCISHPNSIAGSRIQRGIVADRGGISLFPGAGRIHTHQGERI